MGFHPARSKYFQRAVQNAKMYLNHYPFVKSMASYARFGLWKAQMSFRAVTVPPEFDIHRTCHVNPADIEYVCEDPLNTIVARKYANRGKIADGDWDLLQNRFEETDVYQAFEQHFNQKCPWSETPLYKRVMKELESGAVAYDCRSKQQYDQKLNRIDKMYADIRQNGYRSQQAIAKEENHPYKGEDEISVCIGRDGDLLFEDGRHRLCLAKILKLEKVPVKITMVHKKWHAFRMEILDYAGTHDHQVYQRLRHPDLQSIAFLHGEERWELMRPALPFAQGSLLDIGAHWGGWSSRFEDAGFQCHAVESSVKDAYFMRKLARAENKKFEIYNVSIFDYQGPLKHDMVLALNIFHHFIKEKRSFQKLQDLLKRLDMRAMLFQPHIQGEHTMKGAYLDFDNQQFIDFILDNSTLNRSTFIGTAPDDRNIYLLEQ